MAVIPYSSACERNKDAILSVIFSYLANAERVLEIGTGTAQHAVYFAQHHSHLSWQTSDVAQYHSGINAQLELAGVANVLAPLVLDVRQSVWDDSQNRYDVIFTANTLHIMSDDEVAHFFQKLPRVSSPNAILIVYGPFKYNGEFTSPSNASFDQSLRANLNANSSIKDIETICELAHASGYQLLQDHSMPANNQCLIWRKG
jgi:cyclopropane fatty-acyl-phospholipid synthase-like methyltransferase